MHQNRDIFENNAGAEKTDNNNNPYSALADIYDIVMEHVDYVGWARYICSIFSYLSFPVHSILEVACGTGTMTQTLTASGYSLTASDLSPEMLHVAREKLSGLHKSVTLAAASMTALPFDGKFDAVLCLYDSINYLTESVDVARAFNEASRVLKPGGLYVFDICTVKNSELYFANHRMEEKVGDVSYERTCRYDRTERIQENRFVISKNDDFFCETHRQKIYYLNEIEELIAKSPFEIVACFDDMSFMLGSENSERVHYVLENPLKN